MKKGTTNNPNGRPKGSLNKSTTEMRELVTNFVGANLTTLQTDFDQLEPKERLQFLEKLLGYTLPKLQSVTTKDETPTPWEMGEIIIEL